MRSVAAQRRWRFRKPGRKPRQVFLDRIRRLHPRIRPCYSAEHRAWGLVERGYDGQWHFVTWLNGCPTMRTLQQLAEASAPRALSRARVQQWLEKNFDEPEARALEAEDPKLVDLRREGSDRLFSLIGSEHQVAFGPKGGIRKDSG